MSGIAKNITDLIGNTPLLELKAFNKSYGLEATIVAKLESFNPAGSAKDRIGIAMIRDGEKRGLIRKGAVIIEPTSGNTGIALAFAAASKGYRLILTMPDTMSVERRSLLKAYGAEIVLTPGIEGMQGAIRKAEELAASIPGSFIPQQFKNPANPRAHYETTGPEIWKDTRGKVDIFIACAGTGGTVSGTGRFLKEKNPDIKVVAVEPFDSPLLSGGKAGPHKLQGIGPNFIPEVFDRKVVDEIITIKTEEAFEAAKRIARKEGILTGITSGAAAYAAVKLAGRPENKGKMIVALLPDTGERYLSTELFD